MSEGREKNERKDLLKDKKSKVDGLLFLIDQYLKAKKEEEEGTEEEVTVLDAPKIEPIRPSKPVMQEIDPMSYQAMGAQKLASEQMSWSLDDPDAEPAAKPFAGIPKAYLVVPLLLFAGMGISAGWWMLYGSKGAQQASEVAPSSTLSGQEPAVIERTVLSAKEREEAVDFYQRLEDTVRRYCGAEKPEDFKGLIRDEARVMPIIREYYRTHELIPKEFKDIDEFQSIGAEKRAMMGMRVNFQDGGSLPILVEDLPSGVFVDWESERSYQPMPIEDFLAQKPQISYDFRVYARPDNFYAFDFADESKYLGFKLSFRDSSEYLHAYVERGSGLAADLIELMRTRGFRNSPMILRVKFPEKGRGPRSVVIQKIVSKMWAFVDYETESR